MGVLGLPLCTYEVFGSDVWGYFGALRCILGRIEQRRMGYFGNAGRFLWVF